MNRPTEGNFFDQVVRQVRGNPTSFSILLVILVALDVWWDYYHPGGFVLDVVLLFVLFKSYLKSRFRSERAHSVSPDVHPPPR